MLIAGLLIHTLDFLSILDSSNSANHLHCLMAIYFVSPSESPTPSELGFPTTCVGKPPWVFNTPPFSNPKLQIRFPTHNPNLLSLNYSQLYTSSWHSQDLVTKIS